MASRLAGAQTQDAYDRPDDAPTARGHRQQIAWLLAEVGALSRQHHLDQRTLWAIANAIHLSRPTQSADQLLESVRKAAQEAENTKAELAALKASFEVLPDKSLGAYGAMLLAKAEDAFNAGRLEATSAALAELAPINESRSRIADADWIRAVEEQANILNLQGRYDEASTLQLEALDAKQERERRENSRLATGAARSLQEKGDVRGDNEALKASIDLYLTRALPLAPRMTAPLDWAETQTSLGIALATLGERQTGTGNLDKAGQAYHAALLEYTRDRFPLDWALTNNNLGNAFMRLGDRESGTDNLYKAVQAFQAALLERTRERVPLDWAMTETNLGNALFRIGERESGAGPTASPRPSRPTRRR